MPKLSSEYELVIGPTRGWFHLDLPEVWRYRDLLLLLVYREFISKYKQTVLGPAWFILQPVMTTLVFTVIFGTVAQIPTDGIPPVLFYLTTLLGWNYFAQTLQSTSGTFIANANLFGKVYFPRMVVPLSAVLSNLLAFGLQLVTMLCFWCYYKLFSGSASSFALSSTIMWLPLVVMQIGVLSFGVGLWLSASTVKYRDLTFLSPFIIQLWMYATPVIYPLSRIPHRWRWVALLNPMASPTEVIKYMFLGHGVVTPTYIAVSTGVTLLLFMSGVLVFNKIDKTFVDTI